jgi:hypothetical protein
MTKSLTVGIGGAKLGSPILELCGVKYKHEILKGEAEDYGH